MSTGKLGERMPLKSYFEQYQHNQDLVSIAASFLVHIFRMELQTYQVHMSTGKNKLSTHTNDIWSEASRFISKAQPKLLPASIPEPMPALPGMAILRTV
ncbi:hypothetical protein H4R33_004191 [Dimargaris cristalligena]|nr:hypothetical protein H4R33_004191 [Dimargaris cristalligena]